MTFKVRSFTVNIKFYASLALAFALVLGAQAQSPAGKIAVIYLQGAIGNTKDGQKAVGGVGGQDRTQEKRNRSEAE